MAAGADAGELLQARGKLEAAGLVGRAIDLQLVSMIKARKANGRPAVKSMAALTATARTVAVSPAQVSTKAVGMAVAKAKGGAKAAAARGRV